MKHEFGHCCVCRSSSTSTAYGGTVLSGTLLTAHLKIMFAKFLWLTNILNMRSLIKYVLVRCATRDNSSDNGLIIKVHSNKSD